MDYSAVSQTTKRFGQKSKVNGRIKENLQKVITALKKCKCQMLRPHYLIEFIKKEDSYFNWSKLGNGKKSVKRTVPLSLSNI
jgi:hypothetical protein